MSTIRNTTITCLPDWLPAPARHYLAHVDQGISLRSLARSGRVAPSTILRQVRRYEARRDDPLIDGALNRLSHRFAQTYQPKDPTSMNKPLSANRFASPSDEIEREARRILRRLCESDATLIVSPSLEKAVVLRGAASENPVKTAVTTREMAEIFALRDWIYRVRQGRVARYEITSAGRAALRRLIAAAPSGGARGMAEAATPFGEQHRDWGARRVPGEDGRRKTVRYNLAESPVSLLARRKDKDGQPFLSPALVRAAERLREDFEVAAMGPRVGQNWDRFLTGGTQGGPATARGPAEGPADARARVGEALAAVGAGLGDILLRCCCFLDGLETAEKRLGWSARSGKIVLRIALTQLCRHYDSLGTDPQGGADKAPISQPDGA